MPSAHGRAQLAVAESRQRPPALQRSGALRATGTAVGIVKLEIPT
jgi:hypothetical protein